MADGIFTFLPEYLRSSPQGMRTLFGKTRMHKGEDFAARTGTPVTSPVGGRVLRKGFDTSGYGNFIIIQEPDGSTRRFSHLASMPSLEEGDTVTPGAVIGEVGSTGRSTGPHLDYVMRDPQGNLLQPMIADESLYSAFGQMPRPRGDSTPRPIDPEREVRIGTGALGGPDLRKGMYAGPAAFDRLGFNKPADVMQTSQQMIDQEIQKDMDGRPLQTTTRGGYGRLTDARQLVRMTQQAEGNVPMDREGLANVIREDMRQNPNQYPAGLLAEEGIMESPNRMRAEPVADAAGQDQTLFNAAKAEAVDNPEATLDALGAEKPESKFNLAGIGNALVDIGAGIALLEGDTKSARALQAMSKSNRERESAEKQRKAAIGLFTTYGISKKNAEYIVDSGASNAVLSEMMKADSDQRTSAMKNYEFLVNEGISQSEALASAFGKGGTSISLSTGAPDIGTIPKGYQMTYDPETRQYSMQAIPGGEAAREEEQREEQKALTEQQTARAANVVLQDIQRIKQMASEGMPITGLYGAVTSQIPGTEAFDASRLLTTIKANIGFDRLQQMREASPTGGALGQVTERELDTLQSVLGSLEQSQSEEQFLMNLNRLEGIYTDILRKASGYPNAETFGFASPAPAQTNNSQAQPGISVGEQY